MYKRALAIAGIFALSAIAQAQDTTLRPSSFDKNGHLISSEEQRQSDMEKGILQRGGYDPEAAAAAAAARAREANGKNAPKIGNSNTPSGPLSEHSIYRCKKGKTEVYADEENKGKFASCTLVRRGKNELDAMAAAQAAQPQQPRPAPAVADPALMPEAAPQIRELPLPEEPEAGAQILSQGSVASPCSGAIIYQGSTFIFNDQEPCPIPDSVFKSRRPIEANPSYYTQ